MERKEYLRCQKQSPVTVTDKIEETEITVTLLDKRKWTCLGTNKWTC